MDKIDPTEYQYPSDIFLQITKRQMQNGYHHAGKKRQEPF